MNVAKLLVFSVLDSKVGVFAQPFFMRTRGEALRGWIEVCNDSSTGICKYAEDYSLMELGSYDEDTGTFECLPTPFNIGLASTFKRGVAMPQQLDVDSLVAKSKMMSAAVN